MPSPSTIFFLRHGARLDQFDPEWHLSSPTPYDPPLTAKGIAQARQTGAAIQSTLSPLTTSSVSEPATMPPSETTSSATNGTHRPRRRVVIHTSPFLRCIQTALQLSTTVEEKCLLRVDGWLGEWLTPDYYTDIDPPPPSRQLCSSALAGLAGRTQGITVDWMWDSLKFGDGGEYGEEWGSMRERFDRGFKALLRYYQAEDTSARGERKDVDGPDGMGPKNGLLQQQQETEEREETVVIVVTHGAGCNALLGALTGKPVLIDIPISSLSMAVLRPATPSTTPSQCEYELLLQANTAHLSSSSPFAGSKAFGSTSSSHSRESSQSRSPIIPDKRVLEYHPVRSRSFAAFPPSIKSETTPPTGGYQPVTMGRHLSLSVRTTSGLFRAASETNSPSTGLWTPNSSSGAAVSESEDDEVDTGTGERRKRAVGLWKSWAGEQGNKVGDPRGRSV